MQVLRACAFLLLVQPFHRLPISRLIGDPWLVLLVGVGGGVSHCRSSIHLHLLFTPLNPFSSPILFSPR